LGTKIQKNFDISKKSCNFAANYQKYDINFQKSVTMRLEFLLYSLLFVLIGLMLVSFFLIWNWFDARDRLKVVREVTREQTIHAIRKSHNKCRILLYISLVLALLYIPIPFILHDYYGTLAYPGVVILADILLLVSLRSRAKIYLEAIDDYVTENEEHVREVIAERNRMRDEWRRQAPVLNPQAEAVIRETLGDNYEVWYQHDILTGRHVLANRELGLLYAQGVVLPFSEIMEIRPSRKDLKLVTSNSMHPFVVIDFGALPINPETGNKYMDELADKLNEIIH
jgi:hypothetical protein